MFQSWNELWVDRSTTLHNESRSHFQNKDINMYVWNQNWTPWKKRWSNIHLRSATLFHSVFTTECANQSSPPYLKNQPLNDATSKRKQFLHAYFKIMWRSKHDKLPPCCYEAREILHLRFCKECLTLLEPSRTHPRSCRYMDYIIHCGFFLCFVLFACFWKRSK